MHKGNRNLKLSSRVLLTFLFIYAVGQQVSKKVSSLIVVSKRGQVKKKRFEETEKEE